MKCENVVLAEEMPCEWKFTTEFASDCERDGLVHSGEQWDSHSQRMRDQFAAVGIRPHEIIPLQVAPGHFQVKLRPRSTEGRLSDAKQQGVRFALD